MKILVVSDSHGRDANLESVLERVKPIDLFVHCGDVEGSEDYLEVIAECPVHIVAGNNDHFSDLNREEVFSLGEHRVLLTHGHYYYVSVGTERILEEAKRRNADVVIFGHIHRPVHEERDGVLILNPGSVSYPRQKGRQGTYMVVEMNNDCDIRVELKYV